MAPGSAINIARPHIPNAQHHRDIQTCGNQPTKPIAVRQDHLINPPQPPFVNNTASPSWRFPVLLSPHQDYVHYMHAHLLGCHILASARTPPVAFNNLSFDWLPFVSVFCWSLLRRWEIPESDWTGDYESLIVAGSVAVRLLGPTNRESFEGCWSTIILVLHRRRLMGWMASSVAFFGGGDCQT